MHHSQKSWVILLMNDPTAGFGICAINHIFAWYEDLRTCCLNVSSLGGSLTKVESLTVSNMKNTSELWFQTGLITSTKDCRRYIPVHELCKLLSSVVCEILPADHALTGCDTTSARTKFCARQILFKTNTTFTTNGSSVAYEILQKVRWHLTFKQYWFKTKLSIFGFPEYLHMRLTRSNALSKHPIFLIIIGFRITMVNETCIFTYILFDTRK
jgi:hypothetical protein